MTEHAQQAGARKPADPSQDAQAQGAGAQGPAAQGAALRSRVDQFGSLIARGLDLAEAGLSLGVTLVSRVGAVAQARIDRLVQPAGEPSGAAPASPQMQPASPAPEAEAYGICNRLPLLPGGQVRVSFSINNDSMEAPKKVALALEGFVGDAQGRLLDAAAFALKPARRTIAPMDFEKFVLEGVLPADLPPDTYRGWVIVRSDAELRIPVWLAVSSL